MNLSFFKVGRKVLSPPKRGVGRNRALPERLLIFIIAPTITASCALFAQEPRLVNAQTQTRAVTSGLEKEFRSLVKNQVEPAWIGYAVPVVEGNHHICCYSSEESRKPASLRRGRCQLESRDEGMNFNTNGDDDTRENPGRVLVLWRVADRNVGKIRVFTDDCELDAGGLTVQWLTDVKPKESIDLLASFVGETDASTRAGRKQSESAIAAIALHADPGRCTGARPNPPSSFPRMEGGGLSTRSPAGRSVTDRHEPLPLPS